MGLDITALKQARYVEPQPDEDDGYDLGYHSAWVNDAFPDRADGLRSGFYEAEDKMGFRAGSYSGYNAWREWLSRTMLGVAPEVVWNDFEKYADKPFAPLIHFSDCEGIIGPEHARRLAEDFAAHADKVHAHGIAEQREWNVELYDTWRKAFEMAAEDGLVDFH